MRIPGHLTCLVRNLYAGQEAIVRTGYGTRDSFRINNLRYADDTTLMAESKGELKEPLDEGEKGE